MQNRDQTGDADEDIDDDFHFLRLKLFDPRTADPLSEQNARDADGSERKQRNGEKPFHQLCEKNHAVADEKDKLQIAGKTLLAAGNTQNIDGKQRPADAEQPRHNAGDKPEYHARGFGIATLDAVCEEKMVKAQKHQKHAEQHAQNPQVDLVEEQRDQRAGQKIGDQRREDEPELDVLPIPPGQHHR